MVDSSLIVGLYIRRKPITNTPYKEIIYENPLENPIIEQPVESQYSNRENSLNYNNKILLSLLGYENKNARNIGTEDYENLIYEENMDATLEYINDKFNTISQTLSINKNFSLTNFENKNYHEIIGKLKTVKIKSIRGEDLYHLLSLESPSDVAKEQLMGLIEDYYDDFEVYTKCKYNLVNLEKVLENKVNSLDFEKYKLTQEEYYNNLIDYLENLKKSN